MMYGYSGIIQASLGAMLTLTCPYLGANFRKLYSTYAIFLHPFHLHAPSMYPLITTFPHLPHGCWLCWMVQASIIILWAKNEGWQSSEWSRIGKNNGARWVHTSTWRWQTGGRRFLSAASRRRPALHAAPFSLSDFIQKINLSIYIRLY